MRGASVWPRLPHGTGHPAGGLPGLCVARPVRQHPPGRTGEPGPDCTRGPPFLLLRRQGTRADPGLLPRALVQLFQVTRPAPSSAAYP